MGSKFKIDAVEMIVKIEESEGKQGEKTVNLNVEDLDAVKINLSDSRVDDIKFFFDKVFDYIVEKEQMVEFTLKVDRSNLFSEVANDIIDQLNQELKQSKDNFIELIKLK